MSLKGIRFYPQSIKTVEGVGAPIFVHDALERARSDFEVIFGSLFEEWRPYIFVDEGWFRIYEPQLTEAEEVALYDELESFSKGVISQPHGMDPVHLLSAEAFLKFGKYVDEDEGGVFCLFEPSTSLEEITRIHGHGYQFSEGILAPPACVHAIIHNWDGIFWQLFSQDEGELERLQNEHATSERMKCFWVNLAADFESPDGGPPDGIDLRLVGLPEE